MDKLYPLKFFPQFVEKVWGGRKLEDYLEKKLPAMGQYGESWEISEIENYVSVISNGSLKDKSLTECIQIFKSDLLGKDVIAKYGFEFPLLIKFLDAEKDLSIQVHPNDELAKKKGQKNGKSEMWYVLQAEVDATLFKGFSDDTDQSSFLKSIKTNTVSNLLKTVKVNSDDVFYIPSGTIHNIGKGILLAEIQQSSDATYRIYDFNRQGPDGQKRELHLEEAAEALNYNATLQVKRTIPREINKKVVMVESDHFITNRITIKEKFEFIYPKQNSFKVLICIQGKGLLSGDFDPIPIKMGETLLIPACLEKLALETDTMIELLESQIP